MDEMDDKLSQVEFKSLEIIRIQSMGIGTRVCADFIDRLASDEGVLVGNTGHGFIKVMAETRPTATYPAREFRVNLGAVHQYVYLGNDKTCYLSEIQSGMSIPVYGNQTCRYVTVGRVKMEKREFLKVTCLNDGQEISGILQDSDSVFLQGAEQSYHPIREAKEGMKIWGMENQPGRHLGMRIEEDIEER